MTVHTLLLDFSIGQLALIGLIFVWTGFVRTAFGFGGAVLGLPFLLFIEEKPIYWLPIIGLHLLFFTSSNLMNKKNFHNINWDFLRYLAIWAGIPILIGVWGVIHFSDEAMSLFVYGLSFVYGVSWLFNLRLQSNSSWLDNIIIILGGYVAGSSLSGAPLIVAVALKRLKAIEFRSTLFVLWNCNVMVKMLGFVFFGALIDWQAALILLPVAAIGHFIGLRVHDRLISKDETGRKILGSVLISLALSKILFELWRF